MCGYHKGTGSIRFFLKKFLFFIFQKNILSISLFFKGLIIKIIKPYAYLTTEGWKHRTAFGLFYDAPPRNFEAGTNGVKIGVLNIAHKRTVSGNNGHVFNA